MIKTWFITGTSSGFGRGLTEQLLARGDRVAATLRKVEVLDDLKAQYGDRLWVQPLDVTDSDAIRTVVAKAFAELGRIDVIVSNAGYGLFGAAEELTDAQIRHQIDTNLIGSIQLTRAVIPHLRAQGGGRFLQLASMGAHIGFPGLSLYHATKWAIEGFFESVIQEVAPFGIQVTLVEPGTARTDFAGRGAVEPPEMTIYDDTPVGALRRGRKDGSFAWLGDPAKMVAEMMKAADQPTAPKRLTLGSDAYTLVRAALTERLQALDAQKDLALSTDADA